MAAQGKSTGLQIGLILAVVVALIASVAAFIIYRDADERQVEYQQAQTEKENVTRANATLREEIEALKTKVGSTASEMGIADPDNPATVLGDVSGKIDAYNTNVGETTLIQVAENLDGALDRERTTTAEQRNSIQGLQNQLNDLQSRYAKESQQYADARTEAVKDRADVQTATEERIRAEQSRRQEIEDQLATTKAELEEVKEQMANRIAELRDELDDTRQALLRANRKLDQAETKSFAKPDGFIVNLQRSTGTVYLDIGSRQSLRPGVTFSVYDKDKVGVSGGDASALKGSLEVISVDENISEARITNVATLEPLSVGDPIFSPAWAPGRKSKFAFVGMIDLDGDGNTMGERNRLRRILSDADAEITVYIDDDGNWVDGDGDPDTNQPLDVNTEMLVLANIPDPSEVSDPARKQAYTRMREHLTVIREQAERNGIRVKNLKIFLDEIGYVPSSRTFVPGQTTEYRGQNERGRRVDPNPGQQNSGLYSPNRGRRGSQIDPQPGGNRFNP